MSPVNVLLTSGAPTPRSRRPRGISTSLALYADSIDGTAEAMDKRAPGGQQDARVGAGHREQERSANVELGSFKEGVQDGARDSHPRHARVVGNGDREAPRTSNHLNHLPASIQKPRRRKLRGGWPSGRA